MSDNSDSRDGGGTHSSQTAGVDSEPGILSWVPKLGIGAWSFVGIVVALVILAGALAAVSEIILPFTFAAVLAIIFKPFVGKLVRRKLKPTVAASTIVLGLLAATTAVFVATIRGITAQTDQIGDSVTAAISKAVEDLNVDQATLDQARSAVQESAPMVKGGFLTELVSGVNALIGLAGGLILGALIMYYLLKDGTAIRRSLVNKVDPRIRGGVNDFVGDACRTLRDYGQGRTVMSAIVAVAIGVAALLLGLPLVFTIVVANFIGGYIPYIGAFLGGGLAVIVAFGEGGLSLAVVMLLIVLAANLILENFVEPKVMGRTLHIHPLVVLIVTALGGVVGGIVGLILAVPAWVVLSDGISRLRSHGVLAEVADRAQPTLQRILN